MEINYEFDTPFTYEVNYRELDDALVGILCENVKHKHGSLYYEDGAYQMAVYVVKELDTVKDSLVEYFEEELKQEFEDRAYRQYQDRIENDKEEESWYGTKGNFL